MTIMLIIYNAAITNYMSFLGGDKAEDRGQLNPRYVGKLIETRLYAINEKKHYDGVILTFYCPKCNHNNTVMKPLILHNLTMDSFMQSVSSYRFETHACVCGERLNSNNLIIAQYSHFFPETQLDFQAEVTAGSEFVAFYGMDLAGERRPIRKTPDFLYMFETFGRVLSVRECWKYMIGTALQTRNIQMFNTEKGYTVLAVPTESPRARANMREIAGPMWPGDTGMIVRLSDIDREETLFEDTYKEWMSGFVNDIVGGKVDAAAIVDLARVFALIKKTLARDSLDYSAKGDMITIYRKPFSAMISVKDIARESAFTGKSFHDVIEARVDIALSRIYTAENTYAAIKKDMPTYSYIVEGDFLEITNPYNGLTERVNVYAHLPNGGLKVLISRLREALCKNEKVHPVCKCGKDCFVFKTIQPSSWLASTPDSFNYVFDEKENAVILYYISCGEHVTPVMKTDLAQWLADREALDGLFEEELDMLRLNIESHAGRFGRDLILGVMSNKACDIMVHPAFIKGLLNEMKTDLGNRVIAYAPLKELVLIYREDAQVENLNRAMVELQAMAAEKDIGQTPLDYIELFELGKGQGIINLITIPQKPLPVDVPAPVPQDDIRPAE